jgi:hypothetical protein
MFELHGSNNHSGSSLMAQCNFRISPVNCLTGWSPQPLPWEATIIGSALVTATLAPVGFYCYWFGQSCTKLGRPHAYPPFFPAKQCQQNQPHLPNHLTFGTWKLYWVARSFPLRNRQKDPEGGSHFGKRVVHKWTSSLTHCTSPRSVKFTGLDILVRSSIWVYKR